MFAFRSELEDDDTDWDDSYYAFQSTLETEHDKTLEMEERMRNPVAFAAEMMGDIMYFHQAMRQPDSDRFVDALVKEINAHVDHENWEVVTMDEKPEDEELIPAVWAMRRKRNLVTNEITKYKARLNIHGGKQTLGENYWETYAPVVTWFAIRLLIICGIILGWSLRQVDFVMAYTQAPIECDMYMQLPAGIEIIGGNSKTHCLKLLKNLYGSKQAGKIWADYLANTLIDSGFQRSLIDECVWYKDNLVFLVYVDDGIFVSLDNKDILTEIRYLTTVKNLQIEDQGHPNDYVGVNISTTKDGHFVFTQPVLIDSIIADIGILPSQKKLIPINAQRLLDHHLTSPPHNPNAFNYRSAIGKLNYLAQISRPDILYAVHQCARFSSNPREEHTAAIIYLAKYLNNTRPNQCHHLQALT